LLSHRVHLHEALKTAATGVDGKGHPAILRTESRVADVDTSSATITLSDGQKFTGDLVIGADGVSVSSLIS
jgi:2-polyprenyl-6-methoxyphenol hydroxylase-like FAD-dependent oxidoreductase